ncbi:MAG: FHA domain-containing protein, partial [Phycicoccus sp.]
LIGRSPECALVLDDDYASGRHARIYEETDGRWMVEDLRSTNGTFLGATRLTTPSEVAAGSILRIGQTVLELQR